ncbi:MAG: sigma-70 family RNA polymerase sigma factor [Planctomycetaceae bacterium]|nr:sigma-70 family RNA polymerase sigma factor [Planctomycetaceae bacterium]
MSDPQVNHPSAEDGKPGGKENSPGPDAEFIDQFVVTQRRVYLFLLAQLGNPDTAEEILQNTNVVIWSKWNQFEPGTNYVAWVYRIASLEILKYRQKNKRSRVFFDDDFLKSVAESVEQLSEKSEARRLALSKCIDKLKQGDRKLIQQRYEPGVNGKILASKLDRPVNSVYQSLGRIRRTLLECVERQLAASGWN